MPGQPEGSTPLLEGGRGGDASSTAEPAPPPPSNSAAADPASPPQRQPSSTVAGALASALSWARGEGGGAAAPPPTTPPPPEPSPTTAAKADGDGQASGTAAAPLDRTASAPTPPPACLICLDPLSPADFADGTAITLACGCRGDLAVRHRACAERWAAAKGDRTCELCRTVIGNIPEPPPRPAAADADVAEARLAPGMGVLPAGHAGGFGWEGGATLAWPPGAAALAARLPPGHPLLAALADGTLPPLPPLPPHHAAVVGHVLPSGPETLLEFVRTAWVVSLMAVLFFDAGLGDAAALGCIVAFVAVGVARAGVAAREAALASALAGWSGGSGIAVIGGGRRRREQQQREQRRAQEEGVADAV